MYRDMFPCEHVQHIFRALTGHMTTEVNVTAELANSVGLVADENNNNKTESARSKWMYLHLNSYDTMGIFDESRSPLASADQTVTKSYSWKPLF